MLPQLSSSQQSQIHCKGDSEAEAESQVAAGELSGHDQSRHDLSCRVHGQEVSLETPLAWLMDHCASADDFVYVVTTVSPTALLELLSESHMK